MNPVLELIIGKFSWGKLLLKTRKMLHCAAPFLTHHEMKKKIEIHKAIFHHNKIHTRCYDMGFFPPPTSLSVPKKS